jgi:SAM-dependent methyltransferase
MEAAEYLKMAALEDRMWWFGALRANLIAVLRKPDAKRLLDAGCGTGGTLKRLARALPSTLRIGLDIDGAASVVARDKSQSAIATASLNQMPFADGSFDVMISADVLCHAGVNEDEALAEMRRCLAPGGVLLLNLPAYRWLLSEHDRKVHNARRYTARGARQLLARHGFGEIVTSYWNMLLFPLMVLRRLAMRAEAQSDVRPFPPILEFLFGWLTKLETAALRAGLSLPFGGSLLVRAVRHG